MIARPFKREDYSAIKSATRRALEDAAPLAGIAERTRVDGGRLSRYSNPDHPEFIPVDVAMDLDRLSGANRILRAWAELCGFDLVAREPSAEQERCLLQHIGDLGRATGDLHATMCDAVSDGRVTPREASLIERKSGAVDDANDAVVRDMRAIRAGAA